MHKSLLVLGIVSLVLVSGCTQQSPKDSFKDLVEKGKNIPNGKYVYRMDITMGDSSGLGALFGNLGADIVIYSYNGDKKTLVDLMGMVAATFDIGDQYITCTEGGLFGITDVQCTESPDAVTGTFDTNDIVGSFDEFVDEINIEMNGEATYAGRGCYNFKFERIIEEGDTKENSFMGSMGSYEGGISQYDICLDKQYGFPVYTKVTILRDSELTGERVEVVSVSLELEQYNPSGASASDLELPVAFGISELTCSDDLEMKLTAFKTVNGNLDVKMGKYTYGSDTTDFTFNTIYSAGNMNIGDFREVVLDVGTLDSGSYKVEVCTATAECTSSTCYHYASS